MRAIGVRRLGPESPAPRDSVVLEWPDRRRRRILMKSVHDIEFLLDLPQPARLRNGDALLLDTGDLIEVVAAAEDLAEIWANSATQTASFAWRLGNRHIDVEIVNDRKLRIRRDRVIQSMLQSIGAKILEIQAPFEPEGGAYESHSSPSGERPDEFGAHSHGHRHG